MRNSLILLLIAALVSANMFFPPQEPDEPEPIEFATAGARQLQPMLFGNDTDITDADESKPHLLDAFNITTLAINGSATLNETELNALLPFFHERSIPIADYDDYLRLSNYTPPHDPAGYGEVRYNGLLDKLFIPILGERGIHPGITSWSLMWNDTALYEVAIETWCCGRYKFNCADNVPMDYEIWDRVSEGYYSPWRSPDPTLLVGGNGWINRSWHIRYTMSLMTPMKENDGEEEYRYNYRVWHVLDKLHSERECS